MNDATESGLEASPAAASTAISLAPTQQMAAKTDNDGRPGLVRSQSSFTSLVTSSVTLQPA